IDRIGDTGEPCGMPFSTGLDSPRIPSRQITALRSERNDATHSTSGSGILFSRSTVSSRG
ncbi:hypothetical protein PLICRDRAFT_119277, partial [Plicaturopsis crispa FD-325 SS-3]